MHSHVCVLSDPLHTRIIETNRTDQLYVCMHVYSVYVLAFEAYIQLLWGSQFAFLCQLGKRSWRALQP